MSKDILQIHECMEAQKVAITQTLQIFVDNYGWVETARIIRDVVDPYLGHKVNGQDWFAELYKVLIEKPDGSFERKI